MTQHLRDIMQPDPICLDPQTTAEEALNLGRERDIHHFPVQDGSGTVGILCLCDLREAQVQEPIANRMKRDRVELTPEATPAEAAKVMQERCAGSVLVSDGGQVRGIVTKEDLLNARLDDSGAIDALEACSCQYCGIKKHLRRHGAGAYACVECLERAERPAAFDTGRGG